MEAGFVVLSAWDTTSWQDTIPLLFAVCKHLQWKQKEKTLSVTLKKYRLSISMGFIWSFYDRFHSTLLFFSKALTMFLFYEKY